ncbi:MAG: OprO/OprP family phosphate-selective porin [Vicingaceae bacterium]|nr:OprO/OprP family phosphate-selective porin [Vicingaceae bacterium]
MKQFNLTLIIVILFSLISKAQDSTTINAVKKQWFEKFSIRGYAQVRYNTLETNDNLTCEQCDKSIGGVDDFFIRRTRIIFYGQVSKQVYFYIQPDFVSSAGSTSHIAQIRDAYMDLGLDKDNVYRFRVGQSKVLFGFENMQSSQNRLPLDRHDGLNSAISNERDLGVFFYWTPKKVQERMKYISKNGLKGTGNYGMFGFGAYNGQTANQPERNDNKHLVARFSYPIQLGNQLIEPGIQGYAGEYTLDPSKVSSKTKVNSDFTYKDQRVAATFVLYPQPFGIQAEYNIGRGPEFNKLTDSIEVKNLHGGYVTLSYLQKIKNHIFIPFVRVHYFEGGKKHEKDARSYVVKELEIGIEWQPNKNFELVVMYTSSDRVYEDFINQNNHQKGSLLRLQAQVNF